MDQESLGEYESMSYGRSRRLSDMEPSTSSNERVLLWFKVPEDKDDMFCVPCDVPTIDCIGSKVKQGIVDRALHFSLRLVLGFSLF